MAGKISVKTASAIFLLCTVVLVLCACIEPVDIGKFLSDPEVQGVIDSTKEKVYLSSDSAQELKGGNGIIFGLAADKYYVIEKEIDKDGTPVKPSPDYPKFVTDYSDGGTSLGPGGLTSKLNLITRIKDGKINGLTNNNTYTVKSAVDFTVSDAEDFSYSGALGTHSFNSGKITIFASAGATVTFDGLTIKYDGYEVMAVAVSPNNLQSTSPFQEYKSKTIGTGGDAVPSFPLEGVDTTVDYVFYRKTPLDFKVLKVEIKKATYEISLSAPEKPALEDYTFPATQVGYTTLPELTVTVKNIGNQDTGPLTATLSGADLGDFTLSGGGSISSIPFNGSDSFTVRPNTGLIVGTYNANVNVAGSNGISAKFSVSFTVYDSGVDFTNITFNYNDEIDDLIPTTSIGKLKRGSYNGTEKVVINFNAGSASWSDFKWMIDNTEVTSKVTGPVSNVYTLTINNNIDGDFGALLGTTEFTVSVSAVFGVKRYSKMITISVED